MTIEIGTEIEPTIGNGHASVRVAGIPRHISQYQPRNQRLLYRQGWVCGTEFTTRDDIGGRKMLQDFIEENIDREVEKKEG